MIWQTLYLHDVLVDAKSGFACGEDAPAGVFQFRMNNITSEGTLDLSKKRRIPHTTRNLDAFLVSSGDVLFNATNSPELVGKSAFVSGLEEPAVFSNHFLRLRPKAERLDGRFLARWLSLQFQRRVFQGMCRQWVNQATVGRDSLLALKLPVPPLDEQRRIIEVLDCAERVRAKRRAALGKLNHLIRSIFLDLFGDPICNSKGWSVCELRAVADFENGDRSSSYPSGDDIKKEGILFLSTRNIVEDQLELSTTAFISEEKFRSLSRGKAQKHDLLITLRGTLGSCCIFDTQYDTAFINAQMMIIRPKPICLYKYLHALLTSKQAKDHFVRIGSGAAVPQLTASQLGSLKIPLPPLHLQQKFAFCVDAIEKQKSAQRASLAKLDELFASIQRLAFRGELFKEETHDEPLQLSIPGL